MAKQRRYSEGDVAEALAALDANAGNVSGTAKQLGIPQKTLEAWAKGQKGKPPTDVDSGLRAEKKENLADAFERLARKMLGRAEEVASETAAYPATIAAGIATDKMRLLRGESTGITEERVRVVEVVLTDENDEDTGTGRGIAGPSEVPPAQGATGSVEEHSAVSAGAGGDAGGEDFVLPAVATPRD